MPDDPNIDEDLAPAWETEPEVDIPCPPEPEPAPIPEPRPPGLDPAIANQLTLQTLTSALQQQQLNALQARNMVANAGNVLTLGVQLNYTAMLRALTSTSPVAAAAMDNAIKAANPTTLAALRAYGVAPKGV